MDPTPMTKAESPLASLQSCIWAKGGIEAQSCESPAQKRQSLRESVCMSDWKGIEPIEFYILGMGLEPSILLYKRCLDS